MRFSKLKEYCDSRPMVIIQFSRGCEAFYTFLTTIQGTKFKLVVYAICEAQAWNHLGDAMPGQGRENAILLDSSNPEDDE